LISGETFACFNQEQHGSEPSIQRQVGVIEDSSRCNRELVVALFAVKQLSLSRQFDSFTVTARALRAIRPAQTAEQFTAFHVGIKQVLNV
jgi:hypothetical protein